VVVGALPPPPPPAPVCAVTKVLKRWLLSAEHYDFPYPNDEEKARLSEITGISLRQLNTWFTNSRKRWVVQPPCRACAGVCPVSWCMPVPMSRAAPPCVCPCVYRACLCVSVNA
jgi:hypothetical protein